VQWCGDYLDHFPFGPTLRANIPKDPDASIRVSSVTNAREKGGSGRREIGYLAQATNAVAHDKRKNVQCDGKLRETGGWGRKNNHRHELKFTSPTLSHQGQFSESKGIGGGGEKRGDQWGGRASTNTNKEKRECITPIRLHDLK